MIKTPCLAIDLSETAACKISLQTTGVRCSDDRNRVCIQKQGRLCDCGWIPVALPKWVVTFEEWQMEMVPGGFHRIPAHLRRCPTTVLRTDSISPEPISHRCSTSAGESVRCRLLPSNRRVGGDSFEPRVRHESGPFAAVRRLMRLRLHARGDVASARPVPRQCEGPLPPSWSSCASWSTDSCAGRVIYHEPHEEPGAGFARNPLWRVCRRGTRLGNFA